MSAPAAGRRALPVATTARRWRGADLGLSYTHPSTVGIRNPGRTDMTIARLRNGMEGP